VIATQLSFHAKAQAQRRGIAPRTLDLVLSYADRSQGLPGKARALWISRKGRDRLVCGGFAASEVDRTRGVRLIIDQRTDVVMTVEHAIARRAWR
jgi:hypothetical protein